MSYWSQGQRHTYLCKLLQCLLPKQTTRFSLPNSLVGCIGHAVHYVTQNMLWCAWVNSTIGRLIDHFTHWLKSSRKRDTLFMSNWKHLSTANNRLATVITTQWVCNELMLSFCHFSVCWWFLSFDEGCCRKVTFTELPTFMKIWILSSAARVQLRKWCMKWGPLIILPWMKHKEKASFRDADLLASTFPQSALEVASTAKGRRIIYSLQSTLCLKGNHLRLCMSVRDQQEKTLSWFHRPAKASARTTMICI